MKIALTTCLIAGFVGIAVFGIFVMNHNSGHSLNGCIAATANRTDCPKEGNPFSFLVFHLNVFRSFSTAAFGENLVRMLLLLIGAALTIAVGAIASISAATAFAADYHRRRFLESYSFPFQRELAHWLALHENSPAAL